MERKKVDMKLIDPQRDLVRANKRLKALNQSLRRFSGSQAYQLRKSTVTEDGDNYGIIYVDSCNPIPENIPLLVDDVCSSLRSALDHISWKVWLKEDPNFDKTRCFPICDTAAMFEIAAPELIGGLPREQQAIFESAQPYSRGNNYLSILREVSDAEKQRLNPVVSTASIIDHIKLRGMISPSGKFRFITDPSKPPVLEVGSELLRIPLEEFVGEIDVDRKFKYWQVFGSFPEIAEGLAVASTLTDIMDEVKCVFDNFSQFLRA